MDVGLIGPFGYGQQLRERLARIEDVRLCSCYHPNPDRARAGGAERGTSDLSDMLRDPKLEAVLIASPTHLHAEHIHACLEAGKSLFVVKPLVATYAECEQVVRAARTRPVPVFMAGHQFRRTGWARSMKRTIDAGRLGRLVDLELNLSHGGAFNFRMTNWRGEQRFHREGPVNALGVHAFDLLHYWIGPITGVSAWIRNLGGATEAPDAGAIVAEFADGTVALLKTNYIVPSEQRFVITGTDGIMAWDRDGLSLRMGRDVNRVPSKAQRLPCADTDVIDAELREFVRAVAGPSRDVETDLAGAVAAVTVLEACYRSATERRPVSMDEFPLYAPSIRREGIGPAPATTTSTSR